MLGIYVTGEVPFKNILFHGLVNDPYGKKMSKSKGNAVNPLEIADQYGADAVRFALIYGNATGNDQALSYPKLESARKFTNKLWNIGRFIDMNRTQNSSVPSGGNVKTQSLKELLKIAKNKNDSEVIDEVGKLVKKVTEDLGKYNFNYAAEALYEFIWHEFADKYIEDVKNRIDKKSFIVLNSLFIVLLKLLHPFMPFVTEEIYQRLRFGKSIMIDSWPTCHAS
jgi:valyl-tRNA synthetase